MATDPYTNLAKALVAEGIRCHFQTPGQMVVSTQEGPTWPNRGNSFWVTHVDDGWHLFTWVPVGYRVGDQSRIVELCRSFVTFGDRAAATVPPQLIAEFGLIELSDTDVQAVFRAMETG